MSQIIPQEARTHQVIRLETVQHTRWCIHINDCVGNDAANVAALMRKLTFGPKFQNLGRPNEAAESDDALRSHQRLQEADGEGGRRERLRLLDLFLWLRHVALQA